MIHDFYHNTREEIKELEARIRNYDTKMQEAEMKHRTDVASHMQKVKHLEYENANSCEKVKADGTSYEKDENEANIKTEKDNLKDKKTAKEEYKTTHTANIGNVDSKEADLKKENANTSSMLETKKKELIEKYENKMDELQK